MTLRRGRRLGLDIGSVRIGVAACDPDGILATPLAVIRRADEPAALRPAGDHRRVRTHRDPRRRPEVLDGSARAAAAAALDFARRIDTDVPIRLVDERFSTVEAHSSLADGQELTAAPRDRRRTGGRHHSAERARVRTQHGQARRSGAPEQESEQ